MASWTRDFVEIAGVRTELHRGGQGAPLLVLHGAGGNAGWLQYHDALAEHYDVLVPSHPGFGETERPDWMETISDVAHFYTWFLREMGLSNVNLMGHSMGGWIASELVAMCSHSFNKLVLGAPAGIKPEVGEITDIFLLSPEQVIERLFHDSSQSPEYQQLFGQEPTPEVMAILTQNRETSVRYTWKPYMYNPRLPFLVQQVKIPSLIVWGRQDAIIPLNCGELYNRALPSSTLKVIDNCGHVPELEKPQEFVSTVLEFLRS
jgi:pimeloyl-ACP methyl ester carboxylesterase